MGTTTSAATNVTVNGTAASFYGDATFAAAGLSLTSSYTAVASDTNGRWATNTVNVDLAASIPYQYDLNGNLTNDGLRNFAYDDENQLIKVWVTNQWLSQFSYDGAMRRRIRQEFTWSTNLYQWVETNTVYYVYDGNVVVQERDLNNLPITTYTRGLDLSGSLQGGGGIGGLLARTSQQYADESLAGHAYYYADGNGNVTILINSSQAIVAAYLYDAFGNILAESGVLADANRYQFSSKEKDLNSGLGYYGYRFYDVNLQRWLNADPLQESGGLNLYQFVINNPVSDKDPQGLSWKGFLGALPIIGTIINCSCHNPGENSGDYNGKLDCKECKSDPDSAEKACADNINRQALGDAARYLGPQIIHLGIDLMGVAASEVLGPEVGAVLGIDGFVNAACTVKTVANMRDAANQAEKTQCKCPSQ
jgi:RHS repeat-associated protein